LQAAHQRRIKAQERADAIENQLHELITDVERLYRDNAKRDFGKIKERLGYISNPVFNLRIRANLPALQIAVLSSEPPKVQFQSEYAVELVESQAAEIEKLKKLLVTCREQIVQLADGAKK